MHKDLPKVFAVPIDKTIKNNKDIFIGQEEERSNQKNINMSDINKIFNDKTHVYKTKVQITTSKEEKIVELVGIKNNALLTLKGESIPIVDIINIKKV